MAMLYWSSLSMEKDIKTILRAVNDRTQWRQEQPALSSSAAKTVNRQRPHIDTSLPNMLLDDPFYTNILPQLLGASFSPLGVFQHATIGRPNNLHPFSNWSQVAAWRGQCSLPLATMQFGKYETLAPALAMKMEDRSIADTEAREFWLHLRDDVYWQPLKSTMFSEEIGLAPQFMEKHPVTAHDIVFYWQALMNPHVAEAGAVSLRTYYSGIEEIKALDDWTLVVRWHSDPVVDQNGKMHQKIKYLAKSLTAGLVPLPSFVYKYFADGSKIVEDDSDPQTYLTSALWANNFSTHWASNIIVSCGPWKFEGMTDREISFLRNDEYFNRYSALALGEVVDFKETTDAIWQQFKSNKLDSYALQPNQLSEWSEFQHSELYQTQQAQGQGIKRLDYLGRSYTYVGWNNSKPLFARKKVRQALTMAIDRERIVAQNLNGLGMQITCPFDPHSPSYDASIKPWPFDLQSARRFLAEEGWFDKDGDGIIDKEFDGQRIPFRFTLTYYVKNEVTKALCEYIASALKELAIDCNLNGVDIADLSAAFDDKSFDAICLGWALGDPPEDPKQLWYSAGAHEKGSSNAIGFANSEVDTIIDALEYEYDKEKRIELYHRFDRIIHEEAPYTFLYAPKAAFLYRDYLQNVFIPVDRQDLIPGANVAIPDSSIFWIKK